MRDLKFKVQVTGVKSEEKKEPVQQKVIKQTVTVDMKNKKVKDIIPTEEKDKAGYYKALYDMVKYGTMNVEEAAHIAILEIKRVYIDCIGDECSDIETITYLDNLIFNSIEKILSNIIEASFDIATTYMADTYKEVLIGSIKNSVKLLNYEDTFNEDKMIWNINRFVDDFNR